MGKFSKGNSIERKRIDVIARTLLASSALILVLVLLWSDRGHCPTETLLIDRLAEAKKSETSNSDLVLKAKGEGWEAWDRASILHNDQGLECNWSVYKPAHPLPHKIAAPICLHSRQRDAAVSGSIMDLGRWPDCDSLTSILRDSPDTDKVHVEIGANIGSCVMQVLMTTEATVYAFEPHPSNLFVLTSTLMNLDESYRKRVHLFPIALGEKAGSSTIHMNRKNAGNAQVSRNGSTGAGIKIQIERLDNVLSKNLDISLMKMDAQGFECFILDGAPRALRKTKKLVFEVEADQVNRFKECTPAAMVETISRSGFKISRLAIEGKDEGSPTDLPDFTKFSGRDAIDLVAHRKIAVAIA